MANQTGQVGEVLGFIDKRRSTAANAVTPFTVIQASDYLDVATMENYLLGHGYTQAQVNVMNRNDKVYAIRLAVDSGGF